MNKCFRLSMLVTFLYLTGLTLSALAAKSTATVRNDIAQIQKNLVNIADKLPSEKALFNFMPGPDGPKGDPDDCVVSPQRDVQKVWFQDQPGTDLTPVRPKGVQKALSWQDLATYVRSFRLAQPLNKQGKTAIIVVDDFGTPLQYASQDLPGIGGSSGKLTHGELIRAQIAASLGSNFSQKVQIFDVSFSEGEKTSVLNERIERQIGRLASQEYKHIVVNMSFVIMSCSVLNDYKKWLNQNRSIPTKLRIGMKAYIDDLWVEYQKEYGGGDQPTEIFMAAVMSANVIDPKIEDPLGGLTAPSGVTVQRVAAAGNFGLPYALYPAALPSVIGVAATLENHTSPASTYFMNEKNVVVARRWSNAGDVAEVGQWLIVQLNWQGKQTPFYYLGTSFAAPVVTVLTAIYADVKTCPIPTKPLNDQWASTALQPMSAVLKKCSR